MINLLRPARLRQASQALETVIQQTGELQGVDMLGSTPIKSLEGLPLPCCRQVRHEMPSLLAWSAEETRVVS